MPDVTPPAPPAAPPAAPPVAPPAAPPAPVDDLIAPPPPPPPAPVDFKVPEGMKADDALLSQFKPLAAELKLDGAGAQKLVDLYAAAVRANDKAAETRLAAAQTKWRDEVKADPEMGGQNFDTTKAAVARFFNTFDRDGAVRRSISELGLQNHPALVRLAFRAARLISEDSSAVPSAPGAGGPSDADVLRLRYPTMFKS